jgi:hypothetical protein
MLGLDQPAAQFSPADGRPAVPWGRCDSQGSMLTHVGTAAEQEAEATRITRAHAMGGGAPPSLGGMRRRDMGRQLMGEQS